MLPRTSNGGEVLATTKLMPSPTSRAAAVLASTIAIVIATFHPAIGQENEVSVTRNIEYRSIGGTTLAMDAYVPSGPGPHPAVVVIPGGKWVNVDKDEDTWVPIDIANLGVAAFPVNYRPATEAPFPAALEDVQAAVRYLRSHAARFDIDPARIGAVGGSAGGNLAALLATWGEGPTDTGSRVRVAISWSGPMDLERLLDVPTHDLGGIVRTFLGCSATEPCVDQARAASPIRHVDPSDGAVYMGNGTEEIIPLTQATAMQAELERNGVTNQLVPLTGRSHSYGQNEKTMSPAFAFLTATLGIEGASLPSPSSQSGKDGTVGTSSGGEGTVSDGKTEGPVTRSAGAGTAETPWWAIVAIALASVAAVASLIVSFALYRRLRRDDLRPAGPAPDDRSSEAAQPDRSLAVHGTDPPE